ncbi:MAG: hypothetical protein GY756_19010 [bacterium]|nr:hypothetical protein [bacterium]
MSLTNLLHPSPSFRVFFVSGTLIHTCNDVHCKDSPVNLPGDISQVTGLPST